jgi:hypothetical protein
MSQRLRLSLCLLAAGLLFGFHVHLKTTKIFSHPTWNAADETGQFWSEFAVHYRFAKFFAEQPIRQWHPLAQDATVQHPHIVNDWAEFAIAMEIPAGLSYRLAGKLNLPRPPLHVWVVWFDCLMSSLTLFSLFFLSRWLWQSDVAGLLAAVLYAALYPSYGRTVQNLFLKEDFAIPLIVLALAFTVRMLEANRERQALWACASGLVWVAALASWHLTPFVLTVLAAALVLVWLTNQLQEQRAALCWWVSVLAVGGLLVPVLWSKQFCLSPVMCLLIGVATASYVNGTRWRKWSILAIVAGALAVAGMFLQKSVTEYAHVYELFFAKLRYLGVKPEDPAKLSAEARSLWEGAFNTARGTEWWRSLMWCGPLSVIASVWAWKRTGATVRVFVLFAVLLAPLSWMVVRYFTFLGFAAAALAGGVWVMKPVWLRLLGVAAATWQLAMLDGKPMERIPPDPAAYRPVVDWIAARTPTNAVILAHIAESPVFWVHTGRSIILHSKFENREIRRRYEELLDSIYRDEKTFHAFARRYGADYFIYDTGFLLRAVDSRRYKANQMGELPADCAAVLFHNAPEQLKHFRLELTSGRFSVFSVAE